MSTSNNVDPPQEDADHDSRPKFTMGRGRPVDGEKSRRRKREPSFVETTAKLPIASMNKQTEVIVLRDLPRRMPLRKKDKPQPPGPDTTKPFPNMTAKDIASWWDKRKGRLEQEEVNASIEKLRIGQHGEVVSGVLYDNRLGKLARFYNTNQLRKYVNHHMSWVRGRKVTTIDTDAAKAVKIKPVSHPAQELDISPWIPDAVPDDKPPAEEPPPLSKQEIGRRKVAAEILDDCWSVQMENEVTRLGGLEIRMSPRQLNLWLNSTSESLKRLLPSSPFYQKSALHLDADNHIIRIKGPKAEVENMADTVREAYAMSSHQTIELQHLPKLSDFADIFSSNQLEKVMGLTNTYIEYNGDSMQVRQFTSLKVTRAALKSYVR